MNYCFVSQMMFITFTKNLKWRIVCIIEYISRI